MPQIDPDAPWGWNVALAIMFILTPLVTVLITVLTSRKTSKKLHQMATDVAVSRSQVENEHRDTEFPNLRDELSSIRIRLESFESMKGDVSSLKDTTGSLRSEVRDARQDIAGIRTDARRDRRALSALQRMLEEHLSGSRE